MKQPMTLKGDAIVN